MGELAEEDFYDDRGLEGVIEAMPEYKFDRYINGVKMAEGVKIVLEPTLERAMPVAAKIARKGCGGEVPVLIYRPEEVTTRSSTG